MEPAAPRVGAATVDVQVFGARDVPISDAIVSVEADMNHPGMKPDLANAASIGDGKYRAHLDFDMPGDWVLVITARRADNTHIGKQQHITVRDR